MPPKTQGAGDRGRLSQKRKRQEARVVRVPHPRQGEKLLENSVE